MSSRVHKCGWLALVALWLLSGCKTNDKLDLKGIVGSGPDHGYIGGPECESPDVGCGCDEVGTVIECGDVMMQSGDYVSCSMGSRECTIDHVWGECIPEHQTTAIMPRSLHTLAQTGPSKCATNPCDPYCQTTVDDGQNVDDLPTGICQAPTGGIVACGTTCGYAGPHGGSYAALGSTWKKNPSSCMAATDACGYDRDCTGTTCQDWVFPCYDPNPPGCTLTKKVDLQLGPPCKSAATSHIQLCNRGSATADTGTVKIGVFSMSSAINGTLPTAAAPDKGYVTFTLGTGAGKYIDPGKCVDVIPGTNATASVTPALDISGTVALAVNYDKSYANGECNYTNNWQAFDTSIACVGCTNLDCNQTCPGANVTGTIYDPAGLNPVPGVIVYVPNTPVSALTDGVTCDTCSSLYTGTPIASAVTGADGKFTLTNVPVGIAYDLIIQIGRWRRKVSMSALSGTCGTGTPTVALATGENSRLPSNQTEGNIPKMAISLAAGDHLQCLLRKIGIEDSEFTNKNGTGRIHLYAYNGMTFNGTGAATTTGVSCTGSPTGTCATDLWSSPTQLDKYAAIIAPCDKNAYGGTPSAPNPYVGSSGTPLGYAASPYVPGTYADFGYAQAATNPANTNKPPFLTPPDTAVAALTGSPSTTQAANLKTYIDKGGRLFSTHWMAHFLTRDTYPAAVNYVYGTYTDNDRQGSSSTGTNFPYTIDQSTALGQTFSTWANNVGASPTSGGFGGPGTVTFTNWRHLVESTNSPTTRLAYGDSTAAPVSHAGTCTSTRTSSTATSGSPSSCASQGGGDGGPMVATYQFETPWGTPAANQCGRVVVAETHVSRSNSTSTQQGLFLTWSGGAVTATSCDTAAMTGEEKAFEYLLFNATQCVGLVTPPAPATPLSPATFTYDYEADCPSGTQPEWLYFYWQATVPTSTSIAFQAQTADTQASLGAATAVGAGTASANTTSWTSDTNTVAYHLANDPTPAQASKRWLRISMTINPSGNTTPTLLQWRQDFDCKPAE